MSLSDADNSDSLNQMGKTRAGEADQRKITFYFIHVVFKVTPEHQGGIVILIQNF